jgi:hypothetical protein
MFEWSLPFKLGSFDLCPNPPNVSQKQENEDAQAADEDEAKKPESEVKFVAQLSNVTRWL